MGEAGGKSGGSEDERRVSAESGSPGRYQLVEMPRRRSWSPIRGSGSGADHVVELLQLRLGVYQFVDCRATIAAATAALKACII